MVNMGKRRKKNIQIRHTRNIKERTKEAKKELDKVESMWKSKAGCHTGNILVFSTGGVDVYGGGSSRNGCWYRMDPLPDLALGPSDVVKRDVLSFPEGWAISKYAPKPPVIIPIDWPDYSIPRTLKREFWLDLAHDIKTQDIKTVSCQCVGGHGRTGVQLAILAHLLIPKEEHTWKNSAQLIRFVRSRMCEHEVEAASQQKYIADVCQIPLGEDLFPPVNRSAYNNYAFQWSGYDNFTLTKTISHQGEHVYECLSCDNMGFHHEPNQKGVGCDKCQDEMIDVSEYVNKGDEKIE